MRLYLYVTVKIFDIGIQERVNFSYEVHKIKINTNYTPGMQ